MQKSEKSGPRRPSTRVRVPVFISYRDQQELTYQQQDKSDNNSLTRIRIVWINVHQSMTDSRVRFVSMTASQ
jgi:hypothetical protein